MYKCIKWNIHVEQICKAIKDINAADLSHTRSGSSIHTKNDILFAGQCPHFNMEFWSTDFVPNIYNLKYRFKE